MQKNLSIKFRNHFKIDVRFENISALENELNEKGIDFYADYNGESSSESLVQYYLLNKDRITVEEILLKNEIVLASQAIQYSEFSEERKFMSLYLKLIGVFIVLMLLLKTIDAVVNP